MYEPEPYQLRPIALPDDVPGRLFAASMPGRISRNFDADRAIIQESGVDTVVCLASLPELVAASPHYARALQDQTLPWRAIHIPVEDLGVPDDRDAFLQAARHIAALLQADNWVMVHCAAGVGRTGMFAALVLMALGRSYAQARKAVEKAGSGAESDSQRELELWAARQLGRTD
jgi:protein-tyrosine phosphatase